MARILITIPTWNEERVITHTLEIVTKAAMRLLPEHEVVIEVADNASTDMTAALVQNFCFAKEALYRVSLFELSEKGKGLAIRRSWEKHLNDADVFLFMDADIAADVSALPALIQPLLQKTADVVCGSRFVPGATCTRRLRREFASRLYRSFQRVILDLPVKDAQCGFKAITAQAARQLLPLCQETGWLFDTELLAHGAKKGLRIAEIPVHWIEHRDPERRSALRLFRDGWGFLLGIAKIKLRILAS